jgi:iron complex transport system ATP-binding protein
VELKLKGLSFARQGEPVLTDVSATIPGRGLTCLLGANGAGKTTLLRILCGELKATSGEYFIGDKEARNLSRRELARYYSVIPQNAQVPPYLTVAEMVGLGCFRAGRALWWRLSDEDRSVVDKCLARCKMSGFKQRRLDELSGGEQKKAWLAFGLAPEKDFLLLDETLDGLDVKAKCSFFRLLQEIARENTGILMASHDLDMISGFADKVIALSAGRVVFEGAPSADLYSLISDVDVDTCGDVVVK